MTSSTGINIMNKVAMNDPTLRVVQVTGQDVDRASIKLLLENLRQNTYVTVLILEGIGLRHDVVWKLMQAVLGNKQLRYVRVVDDSLTLNMMTNILVASGNQRTMWRVELVNPGKHFTTKERDELTWFFVRPVLLSHFNKHEIFQDGVRAEHMETLATV